MEPNYDAIGRYVSLVESAKTKARERNSRLSKAADIIGKSTRSSMRMGGFPDLFSAYDFDPQPIQEEINKAIEAHQELLALVNEANTQAELCGRPKLEIEALPNY